MRGPKRGLFWQVYLNGLLLIATVTVAVVATVYFAQPESSLYAHSIRLHKVIAAELSLCIDKPIQLQSTLDLLAQAVGRDAAVYSRYGKLLASAGVSPPLNLSQDDLDKIGGWHPIKEKSGTWVYAIPIGGSDSPYLLLKGMKHCFLLAPTVALLALALVSWPLTRAFAKPLERLTAISRTIAEGDLSARSGITRKDEVGVLAHSLDSMAMQLEERIRNEKEMLANISHEIRTPLARLRVALELCEGTPDVPGQIYHHLQGMTDDLSELEQLVSNVLVSCRLEFVSNGRGAVPLNLQHVDLNIFFMDVADRFTRHHPDRPLRSSLDRDLPKTRLDPVLLNRVCENLLENAVKYSEPKTPVFMGVKVADGQIKIEFVDFGEGVSKQDLHRLFEPFFRGDRSRTRQTGGTGLGLTLCKRIIEAHGGIIVALLNDERGMTFQIELPVTTGCILPGSLAPFRGI